MGLIKAAVGAVGGVLADQWKEFFYCEAIDGDTLVVKGQKRIGSRSSNTKGSENLISNGSGIAVADGQCMIIVDQGKVVEVCAEPGEYTYDTSSEPSIFAGNLGDSLVATFKEMWRRFTYGGDTGKDQRIYYFNTKEIVGNKYGTPNPVPFRVVDRNVGLDVDISVRCNGEYSYKLTNPILFYTNVCGNVSESYSRTEIDSQLKSELLTALGPAFAEISEREIRYSALPGHTAEIADALNRVLSEKWRDLRGIEIASFGVNSVTASEEDEKMIKELQRNAAFRDPTMGAAHLVGAQGQAMQDAAKNEGGAFMAFAGMNVAQNMGASAANLYAMGAQQAEAEKDKAPKDGWVCSCGAVNNGKFCTECGKAKPAEAGKWVCSCGQTNTGKFCSECGKPKPAPKACPSCGYLPEGDAPKFCPECGAKM